MGMIAGYGIGMDDIRRELRNEGIFSWHYDFDGYVMQFSVRKRDADRAQYIIGQWYEGWR
jgi:hypothetical protein